VLRQHKLLLPFKQKKHILLLITCFFFPIRAELWQLVAPLSRSLPCHILVQYIVSVIVSAAELRAHALHWIRLRRPLRSHYPGVLPPPCMWPQACYGWKWNSGAVIPRMDPSDPSDPPGMASWFVRRLRLLPDRSSSRSAG
jgi:hypothetical protein